jgi:uncharacterized phage protein gp47/JayE
MYTTPPTYEEMADFLVALFKMLFPDQDVSRTSLPALMAKVMAAAATENHAHIRGVLADLLPDTSEYPTLARWGTISGRPQKGATVARKAAALRLTNSGGADRDLDIGTELVHSSGLRFALNQDITVPAAAGGSPTTRDADVISIDTGSACRLAAGEVLTFTSPPPAGIEDTAELQIAIDEGGDDLESAGDHRRRILARFATPPLGGAAADYVAWSEALEGVASAYCYPIRAGLGTVDVAALHAGTGTDRLLNPSERAALLAKLQASRPVSATVRVLEVLAQPAGVEVTVRDTGEAAYAWDWVDETPLEVDGWDGPTLKLTFSADRPDSMVAGGRLILRDVLGLNDGRQYAIESLSGSDAVILEEYPKDYTGADLDPLSTDLVYSGGELVDPVRDAIGAHIDQLGTANPDATSYGAWEGNLRVAALYHVVGDVPGVRDATVEVPANNVEAVDPAFPGDAQVYVITRKGLFVRREW